MSGAPTQTRYGSPAAPCTAAAAVLRARAAAMGTRLEHAEAVDLAAAAVTADAVVALTGASTIDRPSRYGPAAVNVLAACLARAAGHGSPPEPIPTLECPSAPWLIRLVDEHIDWVEHLVDSSAVDAVLDRVAWDSWAGGGDSVFAAYAILMAAARDA